MTAVLTLLRFVSFDNPWLHLFVPLAPVGLVASLLGLAVLLPRRARLGGLVVVVVGSALALPGPLLPRFGCTGRAAEAAASSQAVTVFSHNASYEVFDSELVAAEIIEVGADVVLLQEVDPAMTAGLNSSLPAPFEHVVTGAGEQTLSLSILSRWPITDVIDSVSAHESLLANRWTDDVNPMLFATVGTPQGELRLANVHLSAPRSPKLVERRRIEVPVVRDQLVAWKQAGNPNLPDLMMGDFNASTSHADFRMLMTDAGYVDGHRLAGCGLGTTWSPLSRGPAVLALDHALVQADPDERVFTIEAMRSHGYAASDHRAVSVVLSPITG